MIMMEMRVVWASPSMRPALGTVKKAPLTGAKRADQEMRKRTWNSAGRSGANR
jgi:hypothetical protein